jgi:DNA modification methylase
MTTAPTMPELAPDAQRGSHSLQRLVGRHSTATLYHDSAENLVRELKGVDCVITDPPYGIEFRNKEWDKEIPRIAVALPYLFSRVAIIMGTEAAWELPKPKWTACWARPASSARSLVGGFSHWSPILLYGDCKLSVDFKSWHASPKPEVLMSWLVNELTEEGQTVLDPFMGSGTTGVACAKLKRNFIGIERDAAHYATACARISHELDGALL